jgi:hypothetical protein
MSNPTRSAMTSAVPSAGTTKSKQGSKRPMYTAPTILTYTDDQLLREVRPADGSRGTRARRA